MPGRRLNNTERRLLDFWIEPPEKFEQPLLKAIAVEGPPAIRGIERLRIPFDYPITAVCGKNGAGKSTVLALAAFSSYRPWDWTVPPWPTHPKRKQPKLTSYAWSDFFFRRPGDPIYEGLTIRFAFSYEGNDIEIERRLKDRRWRTVPDPGRSVRFRLPYRPIEFVSLSRILPPAELQHVRGQFGKAGKVRSYSLDDDLVKAMSAVFRKSYSSITVEERGGSSLAVCETTEDYNGFNMGAGEHAVISIFSALQRLPPGGLLVVEEIEHGLHPEAQHGLIVELTRFIAKKKQQIIFSTHSDCMIDGLPREGRVLIERAGAEHRLVQAPTTRFAMSSMAERYNPEATLYVEDEFSAALVAVCLPPETRRRINVVPIGGSAQVADQLVAHFRGGYPGPAKCIFDGDCTEKEIKKWLQNENPNIDDAYIVLPGGKPPETWVLEELRNKPYLLDFAQRMELETQQAKIEIDRLLALTDHHSIPYDLANRFSKTKDVAIADLTTPLASRHPALDEIRKASNDMLD